MKSILLASVALFACAPTFAAEATAATQVLTEPAEMTVDDCNTAMDNCKEDEACKDALRTTTCKPVDTAAPEVKAAAFDKAATTKMDPAKP